MAQVTNKVSQPDWPNVWAAAREKLRKEFGEAVFDAWIGPLDAGLGGTRRDQHRRAQAVRAQLGRQSLCEPYRTGPAGRAAASPLRCPSCLRRRPPSAPRWSARPCEPAGAPSCRAAICGRRSDAQPAQRRGLANRILHPAQTFDSFVPGQANEFAFARPARWREGEPSDIGLLYIHGGFGYGKTHLLNATALEAKKRGRRPLFLGAEDFMRQFLGALHRKDTLAFKDELRAADLLLIDDLQHICRSSATISEFLHTVNAFADQRRRVVIAADRPPTALDGLGADVRSRLSGGLVIALDKPDRDTRLAILKARAEEFARHRPEAVLPDEVLERIADMEDASPRDLIGIFTKLATYADLTKKPVTLEVVEETVGQRGVTARKTSIEDIQRKTAEFYKLDMRDFHSPQRTRRVARPRQVAMYLARELTMRSLPEIGKRFGGRDHTTVLHACRRIAALCNEDPLFKQEVDFLKQVLSRRGEA